MIRDSGTSSGYYLSHNKKKPAPPGKEEAHETEEIEELSVLLRLYSDVVKQAGANSTHKILERDCKAYS